MKVKKSTIPSDSLTREHLLADYTDAFSCEVETAHGIIVKSMLKRAVTKAAK